MYDTPLTARPFANLERLKTEIHIWQADLNRAIASLNSLNALLSDDEQARADRFHFERHRQYFIAGRGLLRAILGLYLKTDPAQLQFTYLSHGKPALKTPQTDPPVEFNLSHSERMALYAITQGRILGIDLEYLRPIPKVEQLAQRFFSPRESAILNALPPQQQQFAFFQAWTCKEAFLKATGQGLGGLSEVEVSLIPGEPPAFVTLPESLEDWSLYPYRIDGETGGRGDGGTFQSSVNSHQSTVSDYVGALAVKGKGQLRYFEV
ncbi:4'-phosphopantetheinyl transferase family protein [Lusitaniella coriacea]|uniref:4'-phosphopantetheinyl transferase family protein n=1 Tax=Lusitaniella coriacea TaxID=1983105 RepID=UPI003CF88849